MTKKSESFELVESSFTVGSDKVADTTASLLSDEWTASSGNQPESFEVHHDGDNEEVPNFIPLTLEELEKFFDNDGRVVKEGELREAVFLGGCHDEARPRIWSFLFGLYPMSSTLREREQLDVENHYRYHALRVRCGMFMKGWNDNETDNSANDSTVPETALPKYVKHDKSQPDLSELSMENHESMAKIFAWSRRTNLDDVFSWQRVIQKDIPRTDRSHPYFAKSGKEPLQMMTRILTTFGFFHPNIGYVQGMNDILTHFIVVFSCEVRAYWAFSNYMERVQHDFDEKGMMEKIHLVQGLLESLEPNLYTHFCDCLVKDLVFCHRWLLVSFKRELDTEDAIKYFEIIQSQHLELDSAEAVSSQGDEVKQAMKERGASEPKYAFEVFVCVAVIMMKRQHFLACKDASEVFRVACNIRGTVTLRDIHAKAYRLFFRYCKKCVADNCDKRRNLLDSISKVFKWKWKS